MKRKKICLNKIGNMEMKLKHMTKIALIIFMIPQKKGLIQLSVF